MPGSEPTRANEGIFDKPQNEAAPDVNDPWKRMEAWLDEDPEINWIELEKHRGHWGLRMMQACEQSDDYLLGERCVADVESDTLEGALAGALLCAKEFKEGV